MRAHLSGRCFRLRRGGVTPLALVSLGLLLGVVALAVDGGTLMEERRHVQATADAAALAAAADLFANYSANQGADLAGTAEASALATAAANGFRNDGVQSLVTVSVSPANYQGGPNLGKTLPPGYVEVVVQYNAGRTFSNVFGSGAVPVRARAVARGTWAPNANVMMALSLNGAPALSTRGNANITLNGGLQINSSDPAALSVGFNGLTVGSINLNSAAGISPSSLPGLGGSTSVTMSGPVADPLRYLPAPDPAQLGLSAQSVGSGSVINLYPGVYSGGISVGGGTTVILHANSDGTPGIYYLQGHGLNISGNANVTTASGEAGVMIYNNWLDGDGGQDDGINVSGNANLTLTPPASGPYQGVSIFQARGTPARSAPPLSAGGNGSLNLMGTIYAAYASVSLFGNGGGNVASGQIVADTISLGGNASISVTGATAGGQAIANTRTLGLVE